MELLSKDLKSFECMQNGNSICLNIPLGSSDWIEQQLDIKIEQISKHFNKMDIIDDVQFKYHIYKSYVNISKLIWWLRTIPPNKIMKSAKKFDNILNEQIIKLIGRTFDTKLFGQICNSTKRGGLGLRNITKLSSAFYLPAINVAATISKKLVSQIVFDNYNNILNNNISISISEWNSLVNQKYFITEFNSSLHTTKYLISKIELHKMNNYINTLNERDRSIYISQLNKNANAFLNAKMSKYNGMRFTNAEFRVLLWRKLCIRIICNKQHCLCCNIILDEHGDHAVLCKNGIGIIYKHDLIVSTFSNILKDAKIKHTIEERNLFNNNYMKPADILAQYLYTNTPLTALDIGITSVCKKSTLTNCSEKKLFAANNFYSHKNNKYNKYLKNNKINANNIDYQPIILEDYGGYHKNTIKLIKKIATLRAANLNIEISDSMNYCFQRISCTLQRANAIALLHHVDIF